MTAQESIRFAARMFRAGLPQGWQTSSVPARNDDSSLRWQGMTGELHYRAPDGEWLRLRLGITHATPVDYFWYVCQSQGFGDSFLFSSGMAGEPDQDRITALMFAAARSAAEDYAEVQQQG